MIEHRIIVTKSKENLVAYTNSGRRYNDEGKKLSQIEYNEYLNELKFHEGDFITYGNTSVLSLLSIYCVTDIETDASKVTYRYREDDPICLYLVQCQDSPNPWKKWDSCVGYRSLTQEEFDRHIRPEHDRLQDHCNKHRLTPKA